MSWCEANGVNFIFGLSGNAVLDRLVEPVARPLIIELSGDKVG